MKEQPVGWAHTEVHIQRELLRGRHWGGKEKNKRPRKEGDEQV